MSLEETRFLLDHVGIFVSDLERARSFYQQNLNFEFVEEDEDETVWMMTLKGGGQEVHLFKAKSPGRSPHINHLAYRVSASQLESLMSDLKRRGVSFEGPERYKNTRFIKFKDPDGLVMEYICSD